jgi:hypothetical protein
MSIPALYEPELAEGPQAPARGKPPTTQADECHRHKCCEQAIFPETDEIAAVEDTPPERRQKRLAPQPMENEGAHGGPACLVVSDAVVYVIGGSNGGDGS